MGVLIPRVIVYGVQDWDLTFSNVGCAVFLPVCLQVCCLPSASRVQNEGSVLFPNIRGPLFRVPVVRSIV